MINKDASATTAVQHDSASTPAAQSVAIPRNRWEHSRRYRLPTTIRYFVAFGLVAFLLVRTDTREIARMIAGIAPLWFSLALAAMAVNVFLGAWRWSLLLAGLDHRIHFGGLLRFWVVGYFFDNFLPSNVGGDLARGYGLSRVRVPIAAVATSLLLGRVLGFITLGAWAAAVLIASPTIRASGALAMPNLVGMGLGLVLTALLVQALRGRRKPQSPEHRDGRGPAGKVAAGAAKLWNTCRSYRDSPMLLGRCFAISVVSWAIDACMLYSCMRGLGVTVGYVSAVGLNTTLNWAGTIPVSVGGLGVQEATLTFLLGNLGSATTSALAVGIAYRSIRWLTGLAGGLLLWTSGDTLACCLQRR